MMKDRNLPKVLSHFGGVARIGILCGLIGSGSLFVGCRSKAQETAARVQCRNQLTMVALVITFHADDEAGAMPASLSSISPDYVATLDDPKRLVCPADLTTLASFPNDWEGLDPSTGSYRYETPASEGDVYWLFCPIHGHGVVPGGKSTEVLQQRPSAAD